MHVLHTTTCLQELLGQEQLMEMHTQLFNLVAQCLAYTPNQRIVAKDALNHPYFNGLNKETVGTVPLPL